METAPRPLENQAPQPQPQAAAVIGYTYVGNPSIDRREEQLRLERFFDSWTDALDLAFRIRELNGEEMNLGRWLLQLARKIERYKFRLPSQEWLKDVGQNHENETLAAHQQKTPASRARAAGITVDAPPRCPALENCQ